MEKRQIAELVNKAQQGNQNAFTILYEETHNSIYFLALKMLKNEEDAFDIVQNTYISAFNNLAKLENLEIFSTWLHQIAANKCKDYLKKNKPVLFANDEQEEIFVGNIEDKDDDFIPQNSLDKAETRHLIMDIIDNSLSDSQRTAIMLFYYEEMTVSKIAEVLECSEGTVKSRLFSARKLIKIGVDEHEKKGVKLYSAAAIPLLTLLLKGIASETNMAPAASGMIIQNVMQQVNPAVSTGTPMRQHSSVNNATKINEPVEKTSNGISNSDTLSPTNYTDNTSSGNTVSSEMNNLKEIPSEIKPKNNVASLFLQVDIRKKLLLGVVAIVLLSGGIVASVSINRNSMQDDLDTDANVITEVSSSLDIQNDGQSADKSISDINSSGKEGNLNLQLIFDSVFGNYVGCYFVSENDSSSDIKKVDLIRVTNNGDLLECEDLSKENQKQLKESIQEAHMNDKPIDPFIILYDPEKVNRQIMNIVVTVNVTFSDGKEIQKDYTESIYTDGWGGIMCYDSNGNTKLIRRSCDLPESLR